jgi:beta-lactam-binding protein with PASTA domain
MRLILLVLAIVVVATGASTGTAGTRKPCVVPRLYTLSISSARALITSSGCRLGGVSYQKPRRAVAAVTNQVPAPGAIVPPSSRVFLIAA